LLDELNLERESEPFGKDIALVKVRLLFDLEVVGVSDVFDLFKQVLVHVEKLSLDKLAFG